MSNNPLENIADALQTLLRRIAVLDARIDATDTMLLYLYKQRGGSDEQFFESMKKLQDAALQKKLAAIQDADL